VVDLTGTPKVIFAPIGSALQVSDASVTGLIRRSDLHQVTVGLAVTPTGAVDAGPLQGFLFPGTGIARRTLVPAGRDTKSTVFIGNRVTGSGRTTAEQLAVNAIDQVKSKEVQFVPSQ
jgi:hypothetical protein